MNHYTRLAWVLLACLFLPATHFAQTRQSAGGRSLGDVAREVREKKRPEVQVSAADAKELFAALDQILKFASDDTGYTKRAPVKRKLLGQDQFHERMSRATSEPTQEEQLLRSELLLKKFGLLPPDFKLKEFLIKNAAKQLGGFYNPQDKTMYLLDWIPLEAQRPIMAHELTHALQDQNYDLTKFAYSKNPPDAAPQLSVTATDEMERSTVRRAIVEGQAMVVYLDYILRPREMTLADAPTRLLDGLVSRLQSYDAPVALHNAPRVIKELGEFPYREGLAFELELLRRGSRGKAFAGVFAHPPRTTRDVLDVDAYLRRAPSPTISIPDLRAALGNSYEAYDTGSISQLDVRIMARDFGQENDIYAVAPYWNGGAYVAVKRPSTGKEPLGTGDVALLYVSRWKSLESARRFAQIYQQALRKRVAVSKEDALVGKCPDAGKCREPLWATRVLTSEGPTFLEIWPGNTLLITHSFAPEEVARLRQLVLPAVMRAHWPSGAPATGEHPGISREPARELSALLYECDAFIAFQDNIGAHIVQALASDLQH